jgi:uncharacterized DUF497 family protein
MRVPSFEWDPKKAASNLAKHKILFAQAIRAFDDPFALIAPDEEHSQEEEREWILGEADPGVLVIIFTRREADDHQVLRLVSARKANKKEKALYEKFKRISLP